MKNPLKIPYLLSVVAVLFPPWTDLNQNGVPEHFIEEWNFILNGGFYNAINPLVLFLELALIWGGFFVFRNSTLLSDLFDSPTPSE